MSSLRPVLQVLLPLALLAGGGGLAAVIANKPTQPKVEAPPALGPLVRVATAIASDARIDVDTQGTVEAFRTVELSTQVGGRIVATHPALRAGGVFAANTVLARIDAADQETAIVQQQAAVARAELRVLQEKAEADAAVRAWKQLEGERAADPLVTRAPQIHEAEAALLAARASLTKSRLDLQRTEVIVPFAGRVRAVAADLGQVVQPGQRLATVFDLSCVEVRLPIPLADTAFVDLPLGEELAPGSGPLVTLNADFGGQAWQWPASLVRVEGEVDRKTRQLTAVARCLPPPASPANGQAPPALLVGMFVQARITGRTFPGTVALPRAALRDGNSVLVVDAEHRLKKRAVVVLRAERDRVLLSSGLAAGERVCVSDLELAADGLVVRIAAEPAPVGR